MSTKELRDALKPVMKMDGFPLQPSTISVRWLWKDPSRIIQDEAAELIAVGWLVRELSKHAGGVELIPQTNGTWYIGPLVSGSEHYPTDIHALVAALVEAKEATKP